MRGPESQSPHSFSCAKVLRPKGPKFLFFVFFFWKEYQVKIDLLNNLTTKRCDKVKVETIMVKAAPHKPSFRLRTADFYRIHKKVKLGNKWQTETFTYTKRNSTKLSLQWSVSFWRKESLFHLLHRRDAYPPGKEKSTVCRHDEFWFVLSILNKADLSTKICWGVG